MLVDLDEVLKRRGWRIQRAITDAPECWGVWGTPNGMGRDFANIVGPMRRTEAESQQDAIAGDAWLKANIESKGEASCLTPVR